jgi:hypothetical protein
LKRIPQRARSQLATVDPCPHGTTPTQKWLGRSKRPKREPGDPLRTIQSVHGCVVWYQVTGKMWTFQGSLRRPLYSRINRRCVDCCCVVLVVLGGYLYTPSPDGGILQYSSTYYCTIPNNAHSTIRSKMQGCWMSHCESCGHVCPVVPDPVRPSLGTRGLRDPLACAAKQSVSGPDVRASCVLD